MKRFFYDILQGFMYLVYGGEERAYSRKEMYRFYAVFSVIFLLLLYLSINRVV